MDIPAAGRFNRRQIVGMSLAAASSLTWPGRARAAHELRAWPAGKTVPTLALTDLDGKPWSLAALKGRPVLLNFWATWCAPCRAEMPSLQRFAGLYARSGLAVLSVNYKEPVPTIRHFLEAVPFSLPVLLDPEGDAAGEWTGRMFPTTVLIDRSGTPRSSVVGELDWAGAEASRWVAPALGRLRAL